MKVAIATEGATVSSHFGRCENFTIVDVEGTTVKEKKLIGTSGNQHGALPGYLASIGVTAVISGGMGSGAHQNLTQKGMSIITGVQGTIDETIEKFIKGELKPTAANCHEPGHGHDGQNGHGHDGHTCNCGSH